MKNTLFHGAARALSLALLLGVAAPSFAIALTDLRADDLLASAIDAKKSLNLNPNQQILWQQVENKSHAILRERQARRERLHQQAKLALDGAKVELRELGGVLDAEHATVGAEDRQLRELWLTMNDALDENQRHLVAGLLAEQLARVADSGAQHGAAARGREEGGGQRRGGAGHGKQGGGTGFPGS